jgi:hypothetical protein
MRRLGAFGLALVALQATAQTPPPKPAAGPPCPPRREQVFIAPLGQPFRSPADGPSPAAMWFAGADANQDGRLTLGEMAADADRFFTTLDLDGNGELAPVEITHYENKIAPEIRLYQSGGYSGVGPYGDGRRNPREERRRNPKGGDDYGGELGAGRLAWLNIPEPVASADLDMNRGVSRKEFASAAAARFALLDKGQAKVLTLATLPPLPSRQLPCPPADGRKRRR